jgi:hypothetical protein
MRTRSPNFSHWVRGAPYQSVSSMRRSARQEEPSVELCARAASFATVPEPMMVPAARCRVVAACAISCAKSKVMSTPALGRPSSTSLT